MILNNLPKITQRKRKRLGRGYGSGKGGHTVGRGTKGQKARGKIGLMFQGTKMRKSLFRRLPMLRGKERFKAHAGPVVINLKYLNLFKKDEKVNLSSLVKKGLLRKNEAKKYGVKILGDGELKVALIVELPASKAAQEKIKKAGGKIVNEPHS